MKHVSLLATVAPILLFACSDASRGGDVDPLGAGLSASAVCEAPRADTLGPGGNSDLVWNGNGYGLVRYTYSSAEGSQILFERHDASGQRIGTPVPILTEQPFALHLVRSDTGYGLAVSIVGGARLIRLDDAGQRLGDDVEITPSPISGNLDMSFVEGAYRIVWAEGSNRVRFARIDSRGQRVVSDKTVSTSEGTVSSPRIASWKPWGEGFQHGIVWVDSRADRRFEIYFAQTNDEGVSRGFARRLTRNGATAPAIVWARGESHFGVFYDEGTATGSIARYLKVREDGSLLSDPLTISETGQYATFSAVWTGTRFGVAFKQAAGLGILTLDANGQEAAPRIPLQIDSYHPALTWTGEGYRAMWVYQEGGGDGNVTQISPLLCP